ncbi:efflux transporter, outer membrane factor lipoprotein, NodT family [Polaromonas sp. CF318]|nr:efflux transporter outer membrane subunit [Polaromonas sp. CF318]EJL89854.1 efflux transporter, outer membrane factor lipoprotein, NodT family [Polaromonas sp. CF318]
MRARHFKTISHNLRIGLSAWEFSSPVPGRRGVRPHALAGAGLSLALLVAGCAGPAADVATPVMPVPGQYPGTNTPLSSLSASVGWREYFPDPSLQTLIAQALRGNRDLRVAALRVAEARQLWQLQHADALPAFAAQAGGDRARVPADLSLSGRPMVTSQYQAGVAASWEPDFWGRFGSQDEAAQQGYLASEEGRDAVTVLLVSQVADAYLGLRELDERIAIADQTLASRAETLRIFRRRVEAGATSRLNLTQAQVLHDQAQLLGKQLSQAREQQLNALALLVGEPVPWLAAAGPLPDMGLLRELDPGLPSGLLLRRPDIMAAEHRLLAANANIEAARAAFFPRVSLTGSLGTASASLDGLFSTGSRAWTFSPAVSLPIFDGGRLRANLHASEARQAIAVANYEKAIQSAFRDVADALAAGRWLAGQQAVAAGTLAAQAERARLSQLRYDNGAAAFLEVLDAQRDLLAARQLVVQLRRALLSSRIGLYAALGGGRPDPSETLAGAPANPLSPREAGHP